MNVTLKKDAKLIVGGEARVALLPPEVALRAKTNSTRRALVGVVVVAALLSGAGFALASVATTASATKLAAAQDRTAELLRQQGDFIEVQIVQQAVDVATAARRVGSATEISWVPYLESIRATLPDGFEMTGVAVESSTPLLPLAAATAPLQGPRVATLVISASGPGLPDLEGWIRSLSGVTGFVDATPGTTVWDDTDSEYDTTVTLHIDSRAYAQRFAPSPEEVPVEAAPAEEAPAEAVTGDDSAAPREEDTK